MKKRLTTKLGENNYTLNSESSLDEVYKKLGELEDIEEKKGEEKTSLNTVTLYCIVSDNQACFKCGKFRRGDSNVSYCSSNSLEKNKNGFTLYPQFSEEPLCKSQDYTVSKIDCDIRILQLLTSILGKRVFLSKTEAEMALKKMDIF